MSVGQSPKELIKILKPVSRTPLACIDSQTPTIGQLIKKEGEDPTLDLIIDFVTYVNDNVNAGEGLTDDMIDIAAEQILDDHRHLRVADLVLISRRIVAGKFGKIYGKMTIPILLGFFDQYFDERCQAAEERSIRESESHKGDTYRVRDVNTDLRQLSDLANDFISKKKKQDSEPK